MIVFVICVSKDVRCFPPKHRRNTEIGVFGVVEHDELQGTECETEEKAKQTCIQMMNHL